MKWYEDVRAIGLKCWFSGGVHPDKAGILAKVGGYAPSPFVIDNGENRNHSYPNCRLAQGDKTPYDGKGQPVPDGVMVEIWRKGTAPEARNYAELVDWDSEIIHYQVQEDTGEAERAKGFYQEQEPTKQIPQQLIDEVVECLNELKLFNVKSRQGLLASSSNAAINKARKDLRASFTDRVAEIDTLTQKLEGL